MLLLIDIKKGWIYHIKCIVEDNKYRKFVILIYHIS